MKRCICLPILLLAITFCRGQEAVAEIDPAAAGIHDPKELEVFLDGVMNAHFETYHLAGAVIAVVKDGELFFTKGYGYSDVENRVPVQPESTLFRVASITKLLTWTTVMQQIEAGKLNPEVDLNQYLQAFKIPAGFDKPVTMNHLMTHSAGFEDRIIGLFARGPDRLAPLETLLASDLPARIRPPGRIAAYSNHGSALAGYIVEQLSGMKWEEYVGRKILQPLEMTATTVKQPVPNHLKENLAHGYAWENGRLVQKGFEYVPLSPAGAASATAGDMARFMIAFLQAGRLGEERILKEPAVRRMFTTLFTHDPRLPGSGSGFLLNRFNGEEVAGHGGDTFYFHSMLLLLPDRDTGLFVSYNSDQGSRARRDLIRLFFNRYFPSSVEERHPALQGFEQRLAKITGTFRSTRRVETTIAKIAELFSTVRIRPGKAGEIELHRRSEVEFWKEVQPFVFRNKKTGEKLLFKIGDPEGRVLGFFENVPYMALEMLNPHEIPGFHFTLFLVVSGMFITTLILPAVTMAVNLRRGILLARKLPTHPRSRALAASTSILFLTFYAGLAYVLWDPLEIVYGVPSTLAYLLVLPILAAVLAMVLLVVTVSAWRAGYWGLAARIHYTLVFLAVVAALWQLNYWNFIGWHY